MSGVLGSGQECSGAVVSVLVRPEVREAKSPSFSFATPSRRHLISPSDQFEVLSFLPIIPFVDFDFRFSL